MKIGKTKYFTLRKDWRAWLSINHKTETEIWLIYYNKHTGKPKMSYNDSVEEALCYGWIDSTIKKIDKDSFAQRYTPRRKNSRLSELNKERIRILIKQRKMTKAGLEAVKNFIGDINDNSEMKIQKDLLKVLKANKTTWENFNNFSENYRKVRIGWIESARSRPEIFEQRLRYFLKMTSKNKMYGMIYKS